MSLYLQLILAAVIFATGTGVGIKYHAGQDAIAENARMEQARADHAKREKAVDTAATGLEADKEKIRTEYVVVTKEVERVVTAPFYGPDQQCFDADGLRALERAIGPARPASGASESLPRPKPTR